MEKSLDVIANLNLSDKGLSDLGALLETSIEEMSYLFQVSKIRANLKTSNMLLVSLNEKEINKGVSTLLSGLVLYLNSYEGDININFSLQMFF